MMDNGTSLKLVKPKLEDCSVESYLPFGIDFSECQVIEEEKTFRNPLIFVKK